MGYGPNMGFIEKGAMVQVMKGIVTRMASIRIRRIVRGKEE